jgi:hypothetical protein
MQPSVLSCNQSHISYSYTLLFNIFIILNGLLRTIIFILDIYIVNRLGSPQWYQSSFFILGFWPSTLGQKFCCLWQCNCRLLTTTTVLRVSLIESLTINQPLAILRNQILLKKKYSTPMNQEKNNISENLLKKKRYMQG